ncbi:MAG: hypothetical protein AB9Q17_03705 [Candidatus Reddybacter sp.]
MTEKIDWKSELPTEEGAYLIDDSSGKERKVRIENMKIDNDPNRPDSFHVIEGDNYFALSPENGCEEWLWSKI